MPVLVGLEGTRRPMPCVYAHSRTEALRQIKRRRAVTAAGVSGALNIWRDDRGVLRSEFMRQRETLDAAVHPNKWSLQAWLKQWWPCLGKDASCRK